MIYRGLILLFFVTISCSLCFSAKSIHFPKPENDLQNAIVDASSKMLDAISQDIAAIQKLPRRADFFHPVPLTIDGAFFKHKGSQLVLTNMKIPDQAVGNISQAHPNMMYNMLDVVTEWKNVFVDASYELYLNRQSRISDLVSGKLRFGWKNIVAAGRVGFTPLKTGVFKSTNYDLKFSTTDFIFEFIGDDVSVQNNEILKPASKYFETLTHDDLTWTLQEILRVDLDNLLGTKSIDNVFGGDKEIVQKYRTYIRENEISANEAIDQLLEIIRAGIIENGISVFPLDDIYQEFRKKFGFVTFSGYVFMTEGSARDLSTIQRKSDFSLIVNDVMELSGSLGFGEVSARYDHYKAKVWNIGPSGEISASVDENSLYFKLIFVEDKESSYGFKILGYDLKVYIGTIKVKATGLSFVLNWLLDIMANSFVNKYRGEIIETIEKYLRVQMDRLIGK